MQGMPRGEGNSIKPQAITDHAPCLEISPTTAVDNFRPIAVQPTESIRCEPPKITRGAMDRIDKTGRENGYPAGFEYPVTLLHSPFRITLHVLENLIRQHEIE